MSIIDRRNRTPALFLLCGCFLVFLLFLLRLSVLQLLEQADYAAEATAVSQRSSYLSARRGNIYYRNMGQPLASNADWFSLYVTPGQMKAVSAETLSQRLATILLPEKEFFLSRLNASQQSFKQILLMNGVTLEQMSLIQERKREFPGISFVGDPRRQLNEDGSAVHVVGYVGRISPAELEELYGSRYQRNDFIGKTGVEKTYDFVLRGEGGSKTEIVDAQGRILDTRIEVPHSGSHLVLTLDRDIQELAEKALGDRTGVALVMRAQTGEILALVSSPWYAPNTFDSLTNYQTVAADPQRPLINRAIQSVYAPASTFKLVVATSLLEQDDFSPATEIFDPGYWRYGDRLFRNWNPRGEGAVDFYKGVAASNNIYFGKMGVLELGWRKLIHTAEEFGLGQKTGIDLEGEVAGLLPDADWKKRIFGEGWTGGDTLNLSIGQGFLQVTPLQVALYTATIANAGVAYRPYVVKAIIDRDEGKADEREREELLRVPLSQERWSMLQKAMRETVTADYGTARGIVYNGVVEVAAKTGTAEIGYRNNWNSWFASYGPYTSEDPYERLVVVTLVEATGEQAEEAIYDWWAPKAADIIYRGIFAKETYEEVIRNYQRRGVWYSRDILISEANNG